MSQNERVEEFMELYERDSWRIRGFVRALVPVHADAEDVFQEVSRTLWTEFQRFRSGTDFLAWARAVAKFKVLQYRRAKSRLPTNMSDAVFEILAQELIASGSQHESYAQFLGECLKGLPDSDREVIEARYGQAKDTKAVAETVNRSVDAVYRSLRRIHKLLLSCIQRRMSEER